MEEIAKKFGDDRRTEILADQSDFSVEDLIAEEDMVITISHTGYIKRISISTYKRQRRGGRGLQGATTKEEDWIEHLFIASTHDYLMFFTNTGQVYWLKVHEIPAGRPCQPGEAGGELHRHQTRRTDCRDGGGAGIRRRQVAHVRHPSGHGEEDRALRLRQRALERHQCDQHRSGRRADRRAALRRGERYRPCHRGRDEHPVPPGRCPGDGSSRRWREGHRTGQRRRGHRHGGDPARCDTARREREGIRQALRALRLPGPETGWEGHHHAQEDRQDRRSSSP